MVVFYVFAAIVLWLGLLSLRGGFHFAKYVKDETARGVSGFTPFASIIVPFRGADPNLGQNISALFDQSYPHYELIFVTDSLTDQAIPIIQQAIDSHGPLQSVKGKILIAGAAVDSGQKVHNQRIAVLEADPRSEVLVFVDTDGRTTTGWLKSLVAPLASESVGAATGYRWFIPVDAGFASHLRSVWNASIASALGANTAKNFCWGGSTAIRKRTFDELGIRNRWRGTVSDDFTMTRVLQEAKLPIKFVPTCLIASTDSCTTRELIEFTNRQLKITRVYAGHLWKPVLVGSLVFCAVFFGGIAVVIVRAWLGLDYRCSLILLAVIFLLGAAKSYVRLRAVAEPLVSYQRLLWGSLPAHLLLWPIASALYLWNAIAAAASRRITWRGITYELISATEAVIISREK